MNKNDYKINWECNKDLKKCNLKYSDFSSTTVVNPIFLSLCSMYIPATPAPTITTSGFNDVLL